MTSLEGYQTQYYVIWTGKSVTTDNLFIIIRGVNYDLRNRNNIWKSIYTFIMCKQQIINHILTMKKKVRGWFKLHWRGRIVIEYKNERNLNGYFNNYLVFTVVDLLRTNSIKHNIRCNITSNRNNVQRNVFEIKNYIFTLLNNVFQYLFIYD